MSDGWYTINCGGIELLRTNPALINTPSKWKWRTPYFDYQIARFHEDLLEVLPGAIEPLPPDLARIFRDEATHEDFVARCEQVFQRDIANNDLDIAYEWRRRKSLSRGHYVGQPDIRIWTESNTTHIRWVANTAVDAETGLRWSVVEDGVFSLPRAQFLDEVRSFHNRFMAAMSARVELIRSWWPRPEVEIDVEDVVREHQQRLGALDAALATQAPHDWDALRDAVQEMYRLTDSKGE